MLFTDAEYRRLIARVIKGERHPLYAECVEHAQEMSWHVLGKKPKSLLERSRPNEDPEVTKYRLENYEPETKAAADKAISIFSKMFNPSLYSIKWPKEDESTKELKEYTLYYFPEFNSLVGYDKDVLLRKMFSDPNAIQVIRPLRLPTLESMRIKPVVIVYGSANIWWEDIDHYLVHLGTRKENGIEIFTFDYYDNLFWRQFEAYRLRDDDVVITEILGYPHEFKDQNGEGEIPAWKLKGIPEATDDGKLLYKSFLYPAAPHWNLAIIHSSDLMGGYIRHIHPQRWVIGEECQHSITYEGTLYRCRGGVLDYPGAPNDKTCPSCKGKGRVASNSPYEENVIVRSQIKNNLEGDLAPPYMGYNETTAAIEAVKLLEQRVDSQLEKGSYAINMDVESKVGEIQSGVAKTIDRSGQHDTIYSVSQVMFDVHLQNQFYFIDKWMNFGNRMSKEENPNLPDINKPNHFDIQSVAELTSGFKVGKDSGLDDNYLQTQQMEIVGKDLSTNPGLKERTMLILALDPLPGKSVDEVDTMVVAGFAGKIDAIIHFNLANFIDRAIIENKDFTGKDKSEQLEILEEYAREKMGDMQIDTGLLETTP